MKNLRESLEKKDEECTVLLIDNLPEILYKLDEENKSDLLYVAESCKKSPVYVFASGGSDELSGLYSKGNSVLSALLSANVSIVTGGALSRQRYITPSPDISYSEQDKELQEFWGYYTEKGKTQKLKLIYNEIVREDE